MVAVAVAVAVVVTPRKQPPDFVFVESCQVCCNRIEDADTGGYSALTAA